ncbi:MAG: glycosyltransferase family 2 protein [Cyclobacteriaceae bacterium]|nr:glycosyltransferase family 2 protein [Cyclobacteriaceae bacterium]
MSIKRSISVVLPNYNGRNLLAANLPSVYIALQKAGVDHEVIIADDASTDESIVFLRQNFNDVKIVAKKTNSGFSPTINCGIQLATKELVLLLNTDVSLLPDYFEHLFHYFDHPDTFGVSGRFIGLNDDIIQDAGKYPLLLGSKKIQPFDFYVDKPSALVATLFVSGGGALVDRKKLNLLGGFDEIYAPFYYEDTDLSMRAWRLGWRCYYEHNAVCRHPASTTINKFNKKRRIWITTQRNKLIFHSLHLNAQSKLIWYSRQAITLAVQAIVLRWKYHIAFFNYLGKRSEIKKSKQRLQDSSSTIRSLEEIVEQIRVDIDKSGVVVKID